MDELDKITREELGKLVREVWMEWAKEQAYCKPSWTRTWEELSEADREVDRMIGAAIWNKALSAIANKATGSKVSIRRGFFHKKGDRG